MKRILYQTTDGVVILSPSPSVTIEFCIKDVPTGSKYKIVDATDVPNDRTFREAWEVTPDSTWSMK
jgi:hypothetical protein